MGIFNLQKGICSSDGRGGAGLEAKGSRREPSVNELQVQPQLFSSLYKEKCVLDSIDFRSEFCVVFLILRDDSLSI